MPINYFIYNNILYKFIEFRQGDEELMQYYAIYNYYADLNNSNDYNFNNELESKLVLNSNKKRKWRYYNTKNKIFKYNN